LNRRLMLSRMAVLFLPPYSPSISEPCHATVAIRSTFFVVLTASSTTSAEFYTTRVLNRSGRPYSANELEFTPNSEMLLLSSMGAEHFMRKRSHLYHRVLTGQQPSPHGFFSLHASDEPHDGRHRQYPLVASIRQARCHV